MSLRMRLILSYFLIVILCLGMIAIVVTAILQGYRDRFLTARLDDMTIPIYIQARSLATGEASLNEVWARLEEQARDTGVYIMLVDAEGNIVKLTPPRPDFRELTIDLPSEGLSSGITKTYHGTFVAPNSRTFIFAAYPFGKLFSYQRPPEIEALVLSVPRSRPIAIWSSLIRPFLWAGLIALAVSVLIAIILARSVYRPIKRVTEAAEEMAQGKYDQEIPVAGPEEVKGLAASFNQMAREIKLSQQRLRDFLADASHQLRTPLTSIRGFAQAILDGTAAGKDTRIKAAQVIEDESKRMIRQVDELLELSRIQSGQIQLARETVNIKELLEHCRDIFTVRAEEKDLILKTDIESLMSVVGDIDRLEQVFSNLLDNAIKHSPDGGEVNIIGRNTTTGWVEITISDNGLGIPPEQLPHVFERFYQADAVGTGAGLGLAIAREIVLAHGGKIEVSSTLGEGTEFTVSLPAGAPDPSH